MHNSTKRLRRAKLALLSLALIPLAGCATMTQIFGIEKSPMQQSTEITVGKLCEAWLVIRYSRHDTPDTIRQAVDNNAAHKAVCGN